MLIRTKYLAARIYPTDTMENKVFLTICDVLRPYKLISSYVSLSITKFVEQEGFDLHQTTKMLINFHHEECLNRGRKTVDVTFMDHDPIIYYIYELHKINNFDYIKTFIEYCSLWYFECNIGNWKKCNDDEINDKLFYHVEEFRDHKKYLKKLGRQL